MGSEALTEAERCHFPLAVEVVKAKITIEGDHVMAVLFEKEDVQRLREIERKCVLLCGASNGIMEASNKVRLTASEVVDCVCDRTFERKSVKSLHGREARLQLIARPIHAWSYQKNDVTLCGMDWELDRAYLNELP